MKRLSPSLRIYIALIITLTILSAITVYLPQGAFFPTQELPASKSLLAFVNACIMLIIYGSLGFIGLRLAKKLGFPDIWDVKISNRERFQIPVFVGVCLGIFLILADALFSQFHSLSALPHPPFPTSLVASAVAGIGEEVIFRLFFIPFWVWLISYVILKGRWQKQIFWVAAILSALVFALLHIPSTMIFFGFNTVTEIPPALLVEIILLNGVISLFAAYYFKKFGFLAPVGIHFWTDIVWHVIWGVI